MSKQPGYNPYPPPQAGQMPPPQMGQMPPPQMGQMPPQQMAPMPPHQGVPGGQMQPPPYAVPPQQGYPMPPPPQNIAVVQPVTQPGQTTVVVHEDHSDNVVLYILLCLVCPPVFIIVMCVKSCSD